MKKSFLCFIIGCASIATLHAQTAAKAVYAEIGGPGLASVNFDTRFTKAENGFGGRIGIGGFSVSDGLGDHVGIVTIPVGINYLLGKDGKNYFELGAGFTYVGGKASSDGGDSGNFSTSFGNLTFGYRLAPKNGGFFFKAQITPVFNRIGFIPYYGGLGFGYKF